VQAAEAQETPFDRETACGNHGSRQMDSGRQDEARPAPERCLYLRRRSRMSRIPIVPVRHRRPAYPCPKRTIDD
jgi:hypothetical protein